MNEADLILNGGAQMAKLNITYNGQQGDLGHLDDEGKFIPDPVPYDLSDADVRRIATESIQQGIPGIDADPNVNLQDFVVDRFPAREDVPFCRLSLRPKTPFGR